jgi:LacI family transcriptional regulator
MDKVTVHTIAKDLGVAPSTVSKILRHTGNFSDDLRTKVLAYIKDIGYVPNASARVLKSRKSWTIGVIYTEESKIGLEHPLFSNILQVFKDNVEKVGYDISFIVRQIGDNHMSYLNWCKNKKVDGVLIVVGSPYNPEVIELVNSDIPCVSTDIVKEHLHTIISDNRQGIELSINHALELGKKRIGMITGPLTATHLLYRFNVYKEILKEKHLSFDENIVISSKGFGFQSGFDATKTLLERNVEKPDFLLVGSDILAFGAIQAIEAMGYKVPDDISVIGYDDIIFSSMARPSLTTIRQNTAEIGRVAAEVLLDMIENEKPNHTAITRIPVELIKRQTTK